MDMKYGQIPASLFQNKWKAWLGLCVGLVVIAWGIGGLTSSVVVSASPVEYIEAREKQTNETFTLPLYQQNGVKYFSAGVGVEEREAMYPYFPLKLVFAAKSGPYVTSVTVSIRNHKSGETFTIPADQVTGPWLFVDLPDGTYTIAARRSNGASVQRVVTVSGSKTQVVYFHWPML